MRYHVFDSERLLSDPCYGTQEHMEKVFAEAALPNEDGLEGINEHFPVEFVSCSREEKSVTYRYFIEPWMLNPSGHMHGGVTATICDITMGVLFRYLKGTSAGVTVHMSVDFTRGIPGDGFVTVTAKAEKTGRNIHFLTAWLYRSSDGELAAFASGEFV